MKIKFKVPNSEDEAAPTEVAAQTMSILSPPETSPESVLAPDQSSPPAAPDQPTPSSPTMAPVAQSDQKVVEGIISCFGL
jgi:hypothetical protein